MNPITFLTDAFSEAKSWEIADFVIAISVGLAGVVAIFRLDQDDLLEDEDWETEELDDEIEQDDDGFEGELDDELNDDDDRVVSTDLE